MRVYHIFQIKHSPINKYKLKIALTFNSLVKEVIIIF